MELGNGTTGTPSNDAGIVIERGTSDNAFIGWDESADKFTVGTGSFTGASTGDLTITTGTLVANIEGNVTGNITGNVTGDLTGNADTATALQTARTIGGVSFDGTANINLPGVNTTGNQDTSGNAATATALETARTIAGQSFDGTGNISIAPTDLTGVTATATEINIMDGDTAATATTLADADRVVVNDAGTMKQVALTDFETYFESALDTLSNVTTVGALDSGSITSGFGSINNGSSAITTTGTITFGTLSDGTDSVTDIVTSVGTGSTNSELATAAAVESRIQAVNSTSNNVTGLTATGAELNAVADVSAITIDTSTAIANNDGIAVFDSSASAIGYFDVDLLDTYFSGTTKTLTNKTLTSPTVSGLYLSDSGFSVEGSSADANETTVSFTNPTADRTITFPDATGNVAVFTTAPTAAIADGTSGQVLTTNGSGVLSFADAGGNLELYAENPSSPTAPSATGTNAVAIGDGASATNNYSLAIGGTASASNSTAVAIGYGATASSGSSLALGRAASATTGGFNTALGYNAVSAGSGGNATALTNSYASGTDSFAAAIANNTSGYGATGANSIAIGDRAKATSSNTLAAGSLTTSSGGDGSTALGYLSSATGLASFTAGHNCTASGKWSQALGYDATTQSISGKLAKANGYFSSAGDAQYGVLVLRKQTSDATPAALISEITPFVTTGNTTNQIILPNNSAHAFYGTIVARQQASGGTASAAWKVEGLIRREGSAGTTVLVNSATTVLDNTPSWGMALSADTTNGGLAITVTGAASTNIRWVATIHTSEVTYA